jgi:hypothetical protein
MKLKVLAALFAAAIAGLCTPGLTAQEKRLAFDWAFVKRAPDGSAVPVDFKEKVDISAGDLFKIHVRPVHAAFIYLVLQDASDAVQLLFPESFDQFTAKGYEGMACFIPEGDDWFSLDSARGTERFILLASSERLPALEAGLLTLGKAEADPKAAAAVKARARAAVLEEIARVRKLHSALAVAAEKPVTIAGGTRGINAAVQKLATRIEAAGFYTRTFKLEH